MGKTVLVIAAGAHPELIRPPSDQFDLVIAADGGLDLAERLRIDVDVVVGDLDSASTSALSRAEEGGLPIEAHATEKDHTDLDLALRRAVLEQPEEIRVWGVGGGRPDHWLTNLALMAAAAHRGPRVEADLPGWTASVVVPDRPYASDSAPGELVSLVPMGGDAVGVVTNGLKYPLVSETLEWGASRGVSNASIGGPIRVEVSAGSLLIFRPTTSTSSEGATP